MSAPSASDPHPTQGRSAAPRVAYQGQPGAFSHQACLAAVPDAVAIPFETFAEALEALAGRACELAMIPVENAIAGPVPEVAALLPAPGLSTIGEHLLQVRLQLLGVPGAQLGEVEVAMSHPMALAQCPRTLASLGIRAEAAYDTAGAAAEAARIGDPRRAAIASAVAGRIYGLHVLRADLQDEPGNLTRFLILARTAEDGLDET